ncbi:MAG: ABC transporter ATP-binding protein [Bdellovibrionales bacterium]|nr:ABC transporter ATP-binding protein [Bdellovibrionales bacterium]
MNQSALAKEAEQSAEQKQPTAKPATQTGADGEQREDDQAEQAPPKKEPYTLPPDLAPEDTAIDVDNITVTYRAYTERPGTFKEIALNFIKERKARYYTTFDALSEVSFKVPKGKIVGFIGSNGAGKSTLLKTLSGVLKPASGIVTAKGRIDSLISLGSGFDREANAIENIYLYGSLHRVPRDVIKARVPKILAFAELEEFAYTPVRYYSSGMYARLGFACALDMNPDILLVDEVLAVGDERFRKRSREAMDNLLLSGKTIVMVSHAINMLRDFADIIGVLSKGKLIYYGDPFEAVKVYRDESYEVALDGKRLAKKPASKKPKS